MKRLPFLDHARGVIIGLVALQHATQTYALYWGGDKYFVVEEFSRRLPIFDGIFMWTDSFIIQALFLIAGMFVIPSLMRHGGRGFWKQKLVRIIIPWILAVLFLAPILGFIQYIQTEDPLANYSDYWLNVHFANSIPQAGYWFLSYLMLLTACALVVFRFFPGVFSYLGSFVNWCFKRPLAGTLILCLLSSAMITIADIAYGTPYWSHFLKFFVARSNMLWTYVLFFCLGLGIRASGVLNDEEKLNIFCSTWKVWLGMTVILSVLYVGYNTVYIQNGAITDNILVAYYQTESYIHAWAAAKNYLPLILPRTIMHGFLLVFQTMAVLSILGRFTNATTSRCWASLGGCSYGIYFFHEHICILVQYILLNLELAPLFKWGAAFLVSFLGSWIFTIGLRRLPILARVF